MTCFRGVVRHGKARGRQLGFPTANLEVGSGNQLLLERGVYVGRVKWEEEVEFGTLINIGVRPTFAEEELVVELHILDFSGDLYGKTLEVTVWRRLREEKAFARVEELKKQIDLDIEQARVFLDDPCLNS